MLDLSYHEEIPSLKSFGALTVIVRLGAQNPTTHVALTLSFELIESVLLIPWLRLGVIRVENSRWDVVYCIVALRYYKSRT